MGPRINKIFGMSRVTSKGSAPELVKRETNTRVMCMVDALKHSKTLCAITMRYMWRMGIMIFGDSLTANIKGKGDVIHIWKRVIRHKFIALDTPTRELLKEKNRALEDMVNAMFLSHGLSHAM
ncbi:hypothetical protein Tco_1460955 [Tanacetum coccineum]